MQRGEDNSDHFANSITSIVALAQGRATIKPPSLTDFSLKLTVALGTVTTEVELVEPVDDLLQGCRTASMTSIWWRPTWQQYTRRMTMMLMRPSPGWW